MGPQPNRTDVVTRGESTQGEAGHVMIETKTGEIHHRPRNAKNFWKTPETKGGKEALFPGGFREHRPAHTFISDSWPPAL